MSAVEVKVPDIGDFKDIAVIEIFVKPGDTVKAEDSLVTLESDKATMDVPSPGAGVVKEMKVKLGDKVSEGTRDRRARQRGLGCRRRRRPRQRRPPRRPQPAAKPAAAPAQQRADSRRRAAYSGKADLDCDMLVLGAGPGGYSAAFRAADLGMKTVLVERYASLGGVCLNVGCIPSKALLHTAAVMDATKALAEHGISFGEPKVDLDKLRAFKDKVVGKLTGGLAGMAKSRKVDGRSRRRRVPRPEPRRSRGPAAEAKTGQQGRAVRRGDHRRRLAGGGCPSLPEDPRIVDSTGALDARGGAEEDAGDRRRHHRPGDGHRVLDARRAPRRGRDAATA